MSEIRKSLRNRAFNRGANGSVVEGSIDLGWALFQTVSSPAGSFSTCFDEHAIVLSEMPGIGPVCFNGVSVALPSTTSQTLSVFRPNDRIAGVFAGDTVYDILLIRPDYVEKTLIEQSNCLDLKLPPTLRLDPSPLFLCIWQKFKESTEESKGHGSSVSEACLQILLMLLVEPQMKKLRSPALNGRADAINRAVGYVDMNLGKAMTVNKLADVAGLSTFHFSRVFKRSMGVSVHQFVLDRRLLHARHMLQSSGESIAHIALECGFGSQSHFTTAFRRRFAVTPRAFRESIQIT